MTDNNKNSKDNGKTNLTPLREGLEKSFTKTVIITQKVGGPPPPPTPQKQSTGAVNNKGTSEKGSGRK